MSCSAGSSANRPCLCLWCTCQASVLHIVHQVSPLSLRWFCTSSCRDEITPYMHWQKATSNLHTTSSLSDEALVCSCYHSSSSSNSSMSRKLCNKSDCSCHEAVCLSVLRVLELRTPKGPCSWQQQIASNAAPQKNSAIAALLSRCNFAIAD